MIWVAVFVSIGMMAVIVAMVVLIAPDKIFHRPILSQRIEVFPRPSPTPAEIRIEAIMNQVVLTVDEQLKAVRGWFAVILLFLGCMMIGTGAALY